MSETVLGQLIVDYFRAATRNTCWSGKAECVRDIPAKEETISIAILVSQRKS